MLIRLRSSSAATKSSLSWSLVRSLDVFVFEDDALKRLDQRLHISELASERFSVFSSEGDKLVVAVANLPPQCSGAMDSIFDYEGLERLFSDYRYDSCLHPVMSAESVFSAGSADCCELVLRPLMAMVDIGSVRCTGDARGLKKLSAYILNASCRCEVMRQNGFRPSELILRDGCEELELRSMSEPAMACRNLSLVDSDASAAVWGGASLYCYPNDAVEESAGSPYTRLVIEGELDGSKRYYPVAIGRGGAGADGIRRDVRYSYDICLSSRGRDDPCGELDPADVVVSGSAVVYPSSLIYASVGESVHVWCETMPQDAPVALDTDALEDDAANGLHTYVPDEDGRGVTLYLKERGTSIVYFEAGNPVFDSALAFIVAR